jgi:hypothetical protein
MKNDSATFVWLLIGVILAAFVIKSMIDWWRYRETIDSKLHWLLIANITCWFLPCTQPWLNISLSMPSAYVFSGLYLALLCGLHTANLAATFGTAFSKRSIWQFQIVLFHLSMLCVVSCVPMMSSLEVGRTSITPENVELVVLVYSCLLQFICYFIGGQRGCKLWREDLESQGYKVTAHTSIAGGVFHTVEKPGERTDK